MKAILVLAIAFAGFASSFGFQAGAGLLPEDEASVPPVVRELARLNLISAENVTDPSGSGRRWIMFFNDWTTSDRFDAKLTFGGDRAFEGLSALEPARYPTLDSLLRPFSVRRFVLDSLSFGGAVNRYYLLILTATTGTTRSIGCFYDRGDGRLDIVCYENEDGEFFVYQVEFLPERRKKLMRLVE